MSLRTYTKKRTFTKTPEPQGAVERSHKALRFVVQKHDASRLHYDFRLELDGVLKSWAVPKGPSLRPSDKRLAVMVEDHPYDYRTFEGVIPEGNYGAGTVLVWDEGTYEPVEAAGKSIPAQQTAMNHGLREGSVVIELHGTKLKGAFSLVRMHGSGGNTWLLVKKDDDYAKDIDVTRKTRSVISGKNLDEVGGRKRRKPSHTARDAKE